METTSKSESKIETDFISWALNKGIKINEKVDLFAHLEKTGRGVKALKDIPKGEVLVEIPPNAYIIPANIVPKEHQSSHPILKLLGEKKFSNWMTVVLQLLHMMSSSEKEGEYFQNWFAILPSTFDTPLYFADEERKQLIGTSVEHLLNVKMMDDNFKNTVAPLLDSHPELWNTKICTLDAFKRVASIVMSRGFHTKEGNGPFLVPVADMFNHNSRNNAELFTEDNWFKMRTIRAIKKGEEIFNTYGQLSNAQLLHTYGFTENDNPFDNVLIPKDLFLKQVYVFCEGDDSLDAKQKLLETQKFLPESFIISKEDMLPQDLLTCLQVFLMDDEGFKEYSKEPILLGDDLETEDDEEIVDVYQIIIRIIEEKLKSYPTTMKEDLTLFKSSINNRLRSCVSVRLAEKRLLMDLKAQLIEEVNAIETPQVQPVKKKKNK